MSLITFHNNKNLLFALIYWALEIITRVLMHYKWEWFQIVENDSYNEYIFVMLDCIANLFSGFLVLYIYLSLKKRKNYDTNIINERKSDLILNSNNIELIEEKGTFHRSKYFIIKFISMVFLYVFASLSFFAFYQIRKDANHYNVSHKFQKDIINQIDILARYILSIIFLRGKALKHYKFSIIVISFSIILSSPIDIYSLYNNPKYNEKLSWIYVGIFSFRAIIYPISDTLVKSIFEYDYLIPENLMFLRGCFETLLLSIITPVLYFYLNVKDDFVFNPNKVNLAVLISVLTGYTIFAFIKGILLLKVIYYFSSQSVSFLIVSESITGSIYSTIDYFNSSEKIEIALSFIEIIGILITTFATLVFDEIIIIHLGDLDKDAENEIRKRGDKEIKYIFRIQDKYIEKEKEKEEEKEEEKDGEKNILAQSGTTIYD